MTSRIHALLVAVDDYPPPVRKLAGCKRDIEHMRAWLTALDPTAAIEILEDANASRGKVIERFRHHLGRAGAGDIALFHYCGHGARSVSNAAFRTWYPDGRDEGLVCIDSRQLGGHDLADKELAVLVDEVARRGAEVVVILDCCHSGSGTRGIDAFRGLRPRLTTEVHEERALETYLDGHYARLHAQGAPLHIPAAPHILLAACERGQLAQESIDRGGIFTSTLVDVLQRSAGMPSYADLFVRCRAAVIEHANDQTPQFETFAGFDAAAGFLGRPAKRRGIAFSAAFIDGRWRVNGGALHGLSATSGPPTFALYAPGGGESMGRATASSVGAQQCDVTPDFGADPAVRYHARLVSLPAGALVVAFRGDAAAHAALAAALDDDLSIGAVLVNAPHARYAVTADDRRVRFARSEDGVTICHAEKSGGAPAAILQALLPALQAVARWELIAALVNPRSALDPSLVDVVCAEQLDGREAVHAGEQLTLVVPAGRNAERRCHVRVRNRGPQTLHVALAYLSPAFAIKVLRNEPLGGGAGWMTLFGDEPDHYFHLPLGSTEGVDTFQLIFSTERTDHFLLEQDGLVLGADVTPGRRAIGVVEPLLEQQYANDWFTCRRRIRLVRQMSQVGRDDAVLADGRIVVKGHSAVTARIDLGSARSVSRGLGSGTAFWDAFDRRDLALADFGTARGEGDDLSVLELSDILNEEELQAQPLVIELDLPLDETEAIVPLAYDGQHVLLGGAASKDADGITRIRVTELNEMPDRPRSLGGTLKLYFFKTWLRRDDVNKLRWLDVAAAGGVRHRSDGVATRVAAARRVLLLVHGIIGDTGGMAAGVQACGLDRQFDLVLTYDYENLSTPIADTALQLKAALHDAGLVADDDKHLTLLVHSMGGLVSRWFIEREGGDRVVDHLVMCGTPNNGSPFGRVDEARGVMQALTAVALNYAPPLIPFSCALMLLLNRSRQLTPALEQMSPASDFIRKLNASPDPGIRYTVIAGDVNAYAEQGDPLFERLVAKLGRSPAFGLLFGTRANDIAVGVESILRVGGERSPPSEQANVACHHLNYFVSDPGQRALRAVSW